MEELTSDVSYKRFFDEESINGEIECNSNERNNQGIGHSIVFSTPKESKTKKCSLNGEANDNLRGGGINQHKPFLRELMTLRDTEIEELSQASDSFRNRFSRISAVSDSPVYSHSVTVAGLEWATRICTTTINSVKFLSVFLSLTSEKLMYNRKPIAISCTSKLLRPNKPIKSETFENIYFKLKNDSYGFQKFISFEELLKPSNLFVIDDSIVIEMDIKVCLSIESSPMVDVPLTEASPTNPAANTTTQVKSTSLIDKAAKWAWTCFYGILLLIGAICLIVIAMCGIWIIFF